MSSHSSRQLIQVDFLKFVREEVPHFFSSILIQMTEERDNEEMWQAVLDKCILEQWFDWCIVLRDKTYLFEDKQTTVNEILKSKVFSNYLLKLIYEDSKIQRERQDDQGDSEYW